MEVSNLGVWGESRHREGRGIGDEKNNQLSTENKARAHLGILAGAQ